MVFSDVFQPVGPQEHRLFDVERFAASNVGFSLEVTEFRKSDRNAGSRNCLLDVRARIAVISFADATLGIRKFLDDQHAFSCRRLPKLFSDRFFQRLQDRKRSGSWV